MILEIIGFLLVLIYLRTWNSSLLSVCFNYHYEYTRGSVIQGDKRGFLFCMNNSGWVLHAIEKYSLNRCT